MKGKVTLITPPDIYENSNLSLLLVNLTEDEQIKFSEILGQYENLEHINIYFYSGETSPEWFLYALARSDYKYVNIDNIAPMSHFLLSYCLTKNNFFYKTSDENMAAICQYINQNRVKSVENFLEITFKGGNEKQK